MIRILSVCCFIFSALSSSAQTKKWIGSGDGSSWNDALNWSPAVVPVLADDVLLDNSVIAVSYTVRFPDGANSVSINSLIITPSGSETIILKLPDTNTSPTAFTAGGPGDAVVLNRGAIFINSSGATGGTPVSVISSNFFRINNGGRYVHNTSHGHTNYLVSRLSTATGTENGAFEFDVPTTSYIISVPGRTFGNLILSSTAHPSGVTYTGNGANPLTINGDFEINPGVTFNIVSAIDLTVKGNYSQASSSIFNLQNGSANNSIKLKGNVSVQGVIMETGTGFPVIELNGTSNQNVIVTGSIANDITLRMNNAAGVTLHSTLTLPYKLDLQNGKIKTDLSNILTLIDNATVVDGSTVSFVEGPMRKIGDDERFLFPVGKGSIYAPVSFYSPGMSMTDAFDAEYFRVNPQTIYGANYESPVIHHISYTEYWRLEKTSGSTAVPATVELTITRYSFANDINNLYVTRYNTGDLQWKNSGASVRNAGMGMPPYITGSIRSELTAESGIFTLATNETAGISSVPVNLISFNAVKTNDSKIKLRWELALEDYSDVEFEIERSVNGNEFKTFTKVNGNSTDHFYTVYDEQQNTGRIRYRLKITEANNHGVYSNVVLVNNYAEGWFINLFPNPVYDNGVLNINSSTTVLLRFAIYDASGKEIKQWNGRVVAGINYMPLQIVNVKSGVYFLSVSDGETKRVIRFVRM